MHAEILPRKISGLITKQDPVLHNSVVLYWLGQAGFLIRTAELNLLIDPYLSDSLARKYAGKKFAHTRMHRAPIKPEHIKELGIDVLLSTHDHTDHLDPDTLKPLYEGGVNVPVCIAPRYSAQVVYERGIPPEAAVLMNAGESFSTEKIRVEAIVSAHEQIVSDSFGNYRFLGYVFSAGGFRIYHSGDGIPYDGLAEQLMPMEIDIALLPVNGRDARRNSNGIPGNFTTREACSLVREARIKFFIAHHFGMFNFNTEDPEVIRNVAQEEGFTELQDWGSAGN